MRERERPVRPDGHRPKSGRPATRNQPVSGFAARACPDTIRAISGAELARKSTWEVFRFARPVEGEHRSEHVEELRAPRYREPVLRIFAREKRPDHPVFNLTDPAHARFAKSTVQVEAQTFRDRAAARIRWSTPNLHPACAHELDGDRAQGLNRLGYQTSALPISINPVTNLKRVRADAGVEASATYESTFAPDKNSECEVQPQIKASAHPQQNLRPGVQRERLVLNPGHGWREVLLIPGNGAV